MTNESPTSRSFTLFPLGIMIAAVAIAALPLLLKAGVVFHGEPMRYGFVNWAFRFPYLLEGFTKAVVSGVLYPRWLPELMAGNGYPTFVFYQPGAFFFALPFAILAPDAAIATKLASTAMLAVGAAGAYRLCRAFTSANLSALCASIFILSPYVMVSLYTRAAISEVFGIMLSPWCLRYTLALCSAIEDKQPIMRPALCFSAFLAALCYTHPFVLIHICVLLGLVWLFACASSVQKKCLIVTFLLATLLSLALSAPYWYSAFSLRHAINYQGIFFDYPGWFRPLSEWLGANAGMNLLGISGLIFARKRPVARACLCAWAWCLFVATPWSSELWKSFPPLRITQLPYRTLGLVCLMQALGLALLLEHVAEKLQKANKPFAPAALCTLMLAMGSMVINPIAQPPESKPLNWPYDLTALYQGDLDTYKQDARNRYNDESLAYDFLPRSVSLDALLAHPPGFLPLVSSADTHDVLINATESDVSHTIRFEAVVPLAPDEEGATVYVRQLYLPGWSVKVNGQQLLSPESSPPPNTVSYDAGSDGRIAIHFASAGNYTVEMEYEGPPGWQLRNLVCLAAILIAGYGLRRQDQTCSR